jgi:xanthosine utilization system XapX-like protein
VRYCAFATARAVTDMNIPPSFEVLGVVLLVGVNGVALARYLLWRRSPALFWLASTLVVVVVGYLILTGATHNIARSLWPLAYDPIKRKEVALLAVCDTPRILGVTLIMLVPTLMALYYFYKTKCTWPGILLGVCFFLLYAFSPIPPKVASLVFSERMLKVPSHCRPTGL